MFETDESIAAFLRIVGFLFLAVGVFPSIVLTPIYIIASIMPHSEPFFYLQILSISYVISALGYFFVVTARNLDKQASSEVRRLHECMH